MITPISQFTSGILLIEGVVEDSERSAQEATLSNLKSYISRYEAIYLHKMLGYEVGEEFIAYLEGRTEDSLRVEKWEMLISYIEKFNAHVSPIACYIFYWYVRNRQTQATTLGVTKNNSDNPVVSPNEKLVTAWNAMVTMNVYFVKWIDKHRLYYKGWHYDHNMLESINELGI